MNNIHDRVLRDRMAAKHGMITKEDEERVKAESPKTAPKPTRVMPTTVKKEPEPKSILADIGKRIIAQLNNIDEVWKTGTKSKSANIAAIVAGEERAHARASVSTVAMEGIPRIILPTEVRKVMKPSAREQAVTYGEVLDMAIANGPKSLKLEVA